MRMSSVFTVIAFLGQAAAAVAAPALTFEAQAVSVSGVTPRGQVAWFSVAREIEEYSARIVRRDDLVADTDGDGVVRFALDRDVPKQSIWVAVDLATGASAVASPAGFPLIDLTATRHGLAGSAPGRLDWTETNRPMIELLVVRPGVGAWGLLFVDGEADDASRPGDGRLVATLARMQPIGASPAVPDRFNPRDLVFAIDPNRLEYFAERLPEPPQP